MFIYNMINRCIDGILSASNKHLNSFFFSAFVVVGGEQIKEKNEWMNWGTQSVGAKGDGKKDDEIVWIERI